MSMLETVIYVGLLSMLMAGAITTFYSMSSFHAAEREAVALESEGIFVSAKIRYWLSEGRHIDREDVEALLSDQVRLTDFRSEESSEMIAIWFTLGERAFEVTHRL